MKNNADLCAAYARYFRLNALFNYAFSSFDWPFLSVDERSIQKIRNVMVQDLIGKASGLGIDQSKLRQRANEHVRRLVAKKKEPKKSWRDIADTALNAAKTPLQQSTRTRSDAKGDPLLTLLRKYVEESESALGKVPNSEEKARTGLLILLEEDWPYENDQVCEALVLLKGELSNKVLARMVGEWTEERDYARNNAKGLSNIFWVSRNFQFLNDSVSRYRLYESFDVVGFDSTFAEVEQQVSDTLIETPASETRSLAHDLWLASRSKKLTNKIPHATDVAIRKLSQCQKKPFWAEDWEVDGKWTPLPDITTTAFACAAILRLATSDSIRQAAVEAACWLLEQQKADGSWAEGGVKDGKLNTTSSLSNTLIALEAVVRSGRVLDSPQVSKARKWLLKNQDERGFWHDEFLGFPFTTVLALELFNRLRAATEVHDAYIEASGGYLRRSRLLGGEDSVTSHRLALIAAHQGVEAFLYSVLQQKNVASIWIRDRQGQTIGLRDAMKAVQEWLKKQKKLRADEVITHRASIERLAYLRDEVVHKAATPSAREAKTLVEMAERFCSEHSLAIFGFDFLD